MGHGRDQLRPAQSVPPGAVVLVPFPFTDLSGRKQRPVIVVSPAEFHVEDLVVCAVTSQVRLELTPWELPLSAEDLEERRLPKPSVIQVGKLFTIHRDLIRAQFGTLRREKLVAVLNQLRDLFGEGKETRP